MYVHMHKPRTGGGEAVLHRYVFDFSFFSSSLSRFRLPIYFYDTF